jgi:ECF transporter S component (folate family)
MEYKYSDPSVPVSENLRITVTYIVVALESTIVGPAAGMVSAFVTDNLSFILYPDGAYFPGYTLTAMLGSLIYSLCLYQKKITITRIAIAKTINNYLVNVAIGSLWSSMLYGNAVAMMIYTDYIQESFDEMHAFMDAQVTYFEIDTPFMSEEAVIDAIRIYRMLLDEKDASREIQAYRDKYQDKELSDGYYGQKTVK